MMEADAPVRYMFLRATPPGRDPLPEGVRTPISQMLIGGQGGEVRLKLYLSLLWLGARKPYAVEGKPASAWARLFGLPVPATNGAQRVAAAIDWLVENGFITAARQQGRPARLTPRLEDGTGAYERPQPTEEGFAEADRYLKLPQELWSRGWMGVLSAAALTSFIIILDETNSQPDARHEERDGRKGATFKRLAWGPFVWLAESVLVDRYRISYDLWEKGCRELAALELINRRFRGDVAGFGPRQRRRQVQIAFKVLTEGPPKPDRA